MSFTIVPDYGSKVKQKIEIDASQHAFGGDLPRPVKKVVPKKRIQLVGTQDPTNRPNKFLKRS